MIRSEKRLAGLIQYLITHADFLNVEFEQVVVALERGTADHGQIGQVATKFVGCYVRFSSFFAPPEKHQNTLQILNNYRDCRSCVVSIFPKWQKTAG